MVSLIYGPRVSCCHGYLLFNLLPCSTDGSYISSTLTLTSANADTSSYEQCYTVLWIECMWGEWGPEGSLAFWFTYSISSGQLSPVDQFLLWSIFHYLWYMTEALGQFPNKFCNEHDGYVVDAIVWWPSISWRNILVCYFSSVMVIPQCLVAPTAHRHDRYLLHVRSNMSSKFKDNPLKTTMFVNIVNTKFYTYIMYYACNIKALTSKDGPF